MVSFWPFGKGNDKSAESFERLLSDLSTKISTTSAQQDKFRRRERKYKVLWSMYAVFSYILIVAILTLVVGWESWTYVEYVVVGGGPPFIYTIRLAISAYYEYWVTRRQDRLNDLYKQREEAIDSLKKATKYNSTQLLLEKYGGSPPKRKRQSSKQLDGKERTDEGPHNKPTRPQQGRTGFAPPPTANIPSRHPPTDPATSQNSPNSAARPLSWFGPPSQNMPSPTGANEEFAPNAFFTTTAAHDTRPNFPSHVEQKWYDRILDVMLGEDEGSTKNRIALICQNCRLVNGQAPPGARTLEDIGKWRCSACHTMNGVESEESKMLKQISQREVPSPATPASANTLPSPDRAEGNAEHLEDDDSDGSEHEGSS